MNGLPWTDRELELLRELYPHKRTAEVAELIGRSLSSTYGTANKLGLHKSAEYMASPAACRTNGKQGIGTRFDPGHVPANKGLRRPGYAPGRMAETQFKKGVATNWMPIGSTRLIDGYVYRKVSDHRNVPWTRNWAPENRLVWEAANGRALPPKHVLVYRNRDRTDNSIENLELIARADLARRNSIHNLPEELKGAIRTLGSLKRRIRRREEQDRRSA